jgi:hypothetical protein
LRFVVPLFVVVACLVVPGSAAAHPRSPAVALDYRLELAAPPRGVEAEVVDGDRALRLTAAGAEIVVRGLLQEPVLRFARDGVWANAASPTAAADRIVDRGGRGWVRVADGTTFTWHDHRLAPPKLRAGGRAPWSLALTVDGQPAKLTGTFVRAPRPSLWPWLAAGAVALAVVTAVVRMWPARRVEVADVLAGVGALGALAATVAFATGDTLARRALWVEVGSAVVLALVALASLVVGDRRLRIWAAMVVGVVAAALGLGGASVFVHGVVISSLPAFATRVATAVALLAGGAAVVVAVLTPTGGRPR